MVQRRNSPEGETRPRPPSYVASHTLPLLSSVMVQGCPGQPGKSKCDTLWPSRVLTRAFEASSHRPPSRAVPEPITRANLSGIEKAFQLRPSYEPTNHSCVTRHEPSSATEPR